jgi:hypothetical protein
MTENLFAEKVVSKTNRLTLTEGDEILLAKPDENGWCAAVIDRDGRELVDFGFIHADQVEAMGLEG